MSAPKQPWCTVLETLEEETSVEVTCQAVSDLLDLLSHRNIPDLKSTSATIVPAAIYDRAFNLVLGKIDANWSNQPAELFRVEQLMRLGNPAEALFCLLDAVKKSRIPSSRLDVLLSLISTYVETNVEPVLLAAVSSESSDIDSSKEFTQALATLPDRVAHCLTENDDRCILLCTNYFRSISSSLYKSLCAAHARVKSSRNVSLNFCGLLLGKIVTTGQGELVNPLLLKIIQVGQEDFIWRRITQQLFRNIPSCAYEVILLNLLSSFGEGRFLTNLLGYTIDDSQVNLVLTKRLLFNRFILPPKDIILYRNLFGFFCALDDQAGKFKSVLESLLDSWATVYGQKYMALEYELSLTKAILIAVGILRTCIPIEQSYGQKLLKSTLQGVEKRLSSTDDRVRRNGMLIGEAVTQVIQLSPDNFLKFDLREDEETKALKLLLDCRASLSTKDATFKQPEWDNSPTVPLDSVYDSTFTPNDASEVVSATNIEEVDSDDDLVPYSMPSAIKTKSTMSQPKYLQDCYEGLCHKDDVSRRIACLKALPGLISKQPHVTEHMTVDILKALLTMELEGSLREAICERMESLIAITAQNPKPAGAFLGGQSISRNYGIGVRLEMLHIIRSAVERLTSPEIQPAILDISASVPKADVTGVAVTDSKTRRFASATSRVKSSKNQMTHVSKLFLFPLLGYGSPDKTSFTILRTEEALVLSHLINTLGMIVHHSRNIPDNAQLALRVLEFVWEFRVHPDAAVKQAVLCCISLVIPVFPVHFAFGDSSRLVDQVQLFLADVARNDPQSKSVNMALHVQAMLDYSLQQALLPKWRHSAGGDAFSTPQPAQPVQRPGVTLEMIRDISLASGSVSLGAR